MKTGLGLYKKYRILYAYLNLSRFWIRNQILGFDVANQFLQRVDKISVQIILKNNGASIGKDCDIETGLIFHNCKDYSNLIIGNNCHIGKNCFFDLRDTITIGNNVVISMQCTFITHVDLNKSTLCKKYPSHSSAMNIKDNSYLGARVTILEDVQIGKNVIVAAGAVVVKNIEDDVLIGGVPAIVLKKIT